MAIQGPKSDEIDEEGESFFSEVNITPLTDVILVLLIIFMVSSSAMVDAVREGRLEVTLPQAGNTSTQGQDAALVVVGIAADGRVFVDGRVVADDELTQILDDAKRQKPRPTIVLQADGDLQHKKVVYMLDLVRARGFSDVAIGVEPEAAGVPGGK